MPKDAEKIIIRPRGGVNRLIKGGMIELAESIARAAGIEPKDAEDDIFSANVKQQSILIATTSEERGRRYSILRTVLYDNENIEVTAYPTMPEDCGKGVVHDVPLHYSNEELLERIRRRKENPTVLGVRRLGAASKSILILFEDQKVPRW
ncbi:hypothetical protein V5799_007129, partial [Amblyomma americanum]